jgi:hypothetical protein
MWARKMCLNTSRLSTVPNYVETAISWATEPGRNISSIKELGEVAILQYLNSFLSLALLH